MSAFILIISLVLSLPACHLASSIQILTDAALLNALRNTNITDIIMLKSIKLGEEQHCCRRHASRLTPMRITGPQWSYVTPPITLTRNVTVSSLSTSLVLDLDFFPDTIYLGANVLLTFSNMTIINGKRKFPLGECHDASCSSYVSQLSLQVTSD